MALNPQNIVDHKFEPGKSGNPAGRPKGIPNAATRYQRFLNLIETQKNPVTGEQEKFTVAEILDLQQIVKARKGDSRAYKELMDRLEGKAKEAVDITTGGEKISFINEVPRVE
jgi:hypothetical protein